MMEFRTSVRIVERAIQFESKNVRVNMGIPTEWLNLTYVCVCKLDSLSSLCGKLNTVLRNTCQLIS